MKLLFWFAIAGFLWAFTEANNEKEKRGYINPFYAHVLKKVKYNFIKHGFRKGGRPPPVDLMFVIDASVYYRRSYRAALSAIRMMLSYFSISPSTTRLAFITYNTKPSVYAKFSTYHNREAVHHVLYKLMKVGPPIYRYPIPKKFYKSNIGAAMKVAAHLFKTSFTRPHTKKILVTLTSGKRGHGKSDRVMFKDAMNSLADQKIHRIVFAKYISSIVKELAFNKYQNIFRLSGYRLRYLAYLLFRYLPRKADYRRCYKHGHGEIVDECNRRCICYYGRLRKCKRIRQEINSMHRSAKLLYVRTLHKLTTHPTHKPRYDRFIAQHSTYFATVIHQPPEFLPWHRWYLLEMENLLKEVDCRVTVPYWDWSLESHNPWSDKTLFHDEVLGSHPAGRFQCVENGLFGTRNRWTKQAGGCLEREFVGNPPSAVSVKLLLDGAHNFSHFERILREPLHNVVHCQIGGTMCTLDSANAPSFFLHHAFIDKLWWDYQQKNKYYYRGLFYNQTKNMVIAPYRPRQVLNLKAQPGYIHAQYRHATFNSATEVHNMIRKLSMKQLKNLPRAKCYAGDLKKVFEVFHTSPEDMALTKYCWNNIINKHPTPKHKLQGVGKRLGFNLH